MAKGTPIERFWLYVERAGDCWVWVGGNNGKGYGKFYVGGRHGYAHRFAYEHFVGPIPDGHDIDHLCRNHSCVNPAHLEAVTRRENAKRGIRGKLTTHCPSGHPYSGDNLYVVPGTGCRQCRTCKREKMRKRRATRRAT